MSWNSDLYVLLFILPIVFVNTLRLLHYPIWKYPGKILVDRYCTRAIEISLWRHCRGIDFALAVSAGVSMQEVQVAAVQ